MNKESIERFKELAKEWNDLDLEARNATFKAIHLKPTDECEIRTYIDIEGDIWIEFHDLPEPHYEALMNIGNMAHKLEEVLSEEFSEEVKTELAKVVSEEYKIQEEIAALKRQKKLLEVRIDTLTKKIEK